MIDNKKLLGNDNDIFQIKEVLEKSLDNKWTQEFVYLLRKFFYIEYWSNVEKNERYTIQMIQEILKKHLDFLDEDRRTDKSDFRRRLANKQYELGKWPMCDLALTVENEKSSIAIEIALRDCIRINKLILDGGQFESMGIMKKIDAYFMAKEFQKVIQKKRMWSYVSKQMGYRNGNEIEVLYPLCCKRIQFDTLYDAALAAYGYDIKKRMEKLRMKVVIMYGGNELFAAKSVSLVKEKCVSECEVYAYDNMGHSEVLSLHPEKLCEIIRK